MGDGSHDLIGNGHGLYRGWRGTSKCASASHVLLYIDERPTGQTVCYVCHILWVFDTHLEIMGCDLVKI